ncbi:hypothetical protein FOA43_002841 [Brettanomyces nanus]|uniref:HTH CENPB-type domain-containing protein n=1 Tax=Eeniella nana TaxID=13502 RepID=A0A875S2B5_EENNA|nr:uncharacterized protein FOA43_002841 [Brettanomyces nanus]QPG75486.1 hypothetical protein FOA43_002841 [Brettanomyces nanus]
MSNTEKFNDDEVSIDINMGEIDSRLVYTNDYSNRYKKLPRATLEQKITVLDWHHKSERKCQQYTVGHFQKLNLFSVTKSTMNRWVLNEDELRKQYENLTLNNVKSYKTRPKFKEPLVNRCLEILYEQRCLENSPLSEKQLIAKWEDFYGLIHGNLDDSVARRSNGWVHHFKKRNEVKRDIIRRYYKEIGGSRESNSMETERLRLRTKLSHYEPEDIFELDEVSFDCVAECLKQREASRNGKKVIVAILLNSTGTEAPVPLVASTDGEAKYSSCQHGVLTSELLYKYLQDIDSEITPGRRIAVLLNGFRAHMIPRDSFDHIDLVYYSRISRDIQPMNMGIMRSYKLLVKSIYFQKVRQRLIIGGKEGYLKDSLVIDGKELMNDAMRSYRQMQKQKESQIFIRGCFEKSGLIGNFEEGMEKQFTTWKREDFKREEQLKLIFTMLDRKRLLAESFTENSVRHLNNGEVEIDINKVIFPKSEQVENIDLSDIDIVRLAKLEIEIQSSSNMVKDEVRRQNEDSKANFDAMESVQEYLSKNEGTERLMELAQQYYKNVRKKEKQNGDDPVEKRRSKRTKIS